MYIWHNKCSYCASKMSYLCYMPLFTWTDTDATLKYNLGSEEGTSCLRMGGGAWVVSESDIGYLVLGASYLRYEFSKHQAGPVHSSEIVCSLWLLLWKKPRT